MTQYTIFGEEQAEITTDDYYTPLWLFDRMEVRFDLDVASPPGGVPWLPTDHFYTMKDDGLSSPWFGRVWMNPPFSKPSPWVRKFIEHGNGICLLPTGKSGWYDELWESSAGIVSLPANFKFARDNVTATSIFIRVFLAAFGDECIEAIGRIGKVR